MSQRLQGDSSSNRENRGSETPGMDLGSVSSEQASSLAGGESPVDSGGESGVESQEEHPVLGQTSMQAKDVALHEPMRGVSVAPLGDPGPRFAVAERTVDAEAFRSNSPATIAGMLVIVGTIWVATLVGANGGLMVVAAGAICFLVGTASVIHSMLRWENAASAYDKERAAVESWHATCLKLHSDSTRAGTVLSHMTDGIMLLSPTTEIVLLNDAARRLLALPADGVYLGKNFPELVRVPLIVEAVKRAREERLDQNVSVEIVDGATVRPVAVRVDQVKTSDPPNLLLVLRDETESQRVEAIRREFIANVSHELKTPLAAIKGYAETGGSAIEDDPEAAQHFIGQINDQCLRLEDLIGDMMGLARAQSGRGTLVVQSIDLRQVIDAAMSAFRPVASAKDIQLGVRGVEEPVRVMADEEAALTITQNLISNALRHTDSGGQVTVCCRRERSGWVMAVQDDGVGIAEEFQDRIFERFYRVDRTRKTHDGSTGIGLSIVKNLIRAMDGTVQVISRPGDGATFEVWLPSPN